ncbi:MAG: hypothetical protein NT166_00255 [Candidatus Aminicenantes bacterium]|nr:hypothetical protein [Candidatus Aminicenantes bacterium]
MNKKKVVISFERLSTAREPESLKISDMSKLRGGKIGPGPRGSAGGAPGSDSCACGCV